MDRRKVPGPGSDGKAQRLSRTHLAPPAPSPPAGQPSWPFLVRHARCIDADLDPDQWFPVKITGGPPGHTVPDAFVRAANEVEIVDTGPETLRGWPAVTRTPAHRPGASHLGVLEFGAASSGCFRRGT